LDFNQGKVPGEEPRQKAGDDRTLTPALFAAFARAALTDESSHVAFDPCEEEWSAK